MNVAEASPDHQASFEERLNSAISAEDFVELYREAYSSEDDELLKALNTHPSLSLDGEYGSEQRVRGIMVKAVRRDIAIECAEKEAESLRERLLSGGNLEDVVRRIAQIADRNVDAGMHVISELGKDQTAYENFNTAVMKYAPGAIRGERVSLRVFAADLAFDVISRGS